MLYSLFFLKFYNFYRNKMSGAKFGTAQDLIVKPCAICNESVKDLENRLVVEKKTSERII